MTQQEAERELTALRAQQQQAQEQFYRLDGAIQMLTQLVPSLPNEAETTNASESAAEEGPEESPANVVPFPGGESAG